MVDKSRMAGSDGELRIHSLSAGPLSILTRSMRNWQRPFTLPASPRFGRIPAMSFSSLPLSYCCNVHPSTSVTEVLETIEHKSSYVQKLTGRGIAAGLWLADTVSRELEADPKLLTALKQALTQQNLICYTLNAFPFGNFHSDRVKEQVYLPDWTTSERLEYTVRCARLLAELLPDGVEGSISTVPLGFKELATADGFQQDCINNLIQLVVELDQIHDDTGRIIRVAIEPEPLCVLETTPETVRFFEQLYQAADSPEQLGLIKQHLGVCYDICHQSVEFEDVEASIESLQKADIRINKVHITCAIELKNPSQNEAGRKQLAEFAEPRYLHQTFRAAANQNQFITDLTADFAVNPPSDWLEADCWRIHFHVPVGEDALGNLGTTRPDLVKALIAVQALEYAPHLEVETYTWSVMPGETRPDACAGLARELTSTLALLDELNQ